MAEEGFRGAEAKAAALEAERQDGKDDSPALCLFFQLKDEAEVLKNQLAAAEAEITAMKSRLEELEKKA